MTRFLTQHPSGHSRFCFLHSRLLFSWLSTFTYQRSIAYCILIFILSILLLSGCRSTLPERVDGTPFLAESQQEKQAQASFQTKAKAFFQPLLPDRNEYTISPQHASAREPQTQNEPSIFFDPSAFQVQNGLTYQNVSRPSQRYFSLGFETNEHDDDLPNRDRTIALTEENDPEPVDQSAFSDVSEQKTGKGKTSSKKQSRDHKLTNPLQARSGDSEAFRSLLAEIAATPKENWKVDEEELETRLANFRATVKAEKNHEFEAQYLVHLRESIVPSSYRKIAKTSSNPMRKSGKQAQVSLRDEEEESDLEDDDSLLDEYAQEEPERKASAPLPPPAVPSKKANAAHETKMAAAHSKPKYGKLAQLEDSKVTSVAYRPTSQVESPIVNAQYVHSSSDQEMSSDDWETHLRHASRQLRHKLNESPQGNRFGDEVRLRLMELALGNRNEAVRPFHRVEPQFNEVWGNYMLGLNTLLDDAAIPDAKSRIVTSAFRFDEGSRLQNQFCPMKLKNVQFVQDWVTFGVFLPRSEDCYAGEHVGLYLELEHPTIKKTSQGYNVRASISYEILDSMANVVKKCDDIPPVEETTPSQKRDYCIHLLVKLPKTLAHGQYQLRVNVTDLNNKDMQYAEEQLPLRIIPATTPD